MSLYEAVLVISHEEYLTDTPDTIHKLADAFSRLFNHVDFVSLLFGSFLRHSPDRRSGKGYAPNAWRAVEGVRCLQWIPSWRAGNAGGVLRRSLTAPVFDVWATWPSPEIDEAAKRATVIIVHSGPSAALIGHLRQRAPRARIIYLVTDLAAATNVHPRVQAMLQNCVDRVVVVARAMLPHFQGFGRRVSFVPLGVDEPRSKAAATSPYQEPCNAVTEESNLFDPSVLQIAASFFPEVQFHLFGAPVGNRYPANVRQHGKRPADEVFPYLKHASLGIAAYADTTDPHHLADSSLPLLQFGDLGIPAVCPAFAVGDKALRVGYEPGRSGSVRDAFSRALLMQPGTIRVPAPRWAEVARQVVEAEPLPIEDGAASSFRQPETAHGQ